MKKILAISLLVSSLGTAMAQNSQELKLPTKEDARVGLGQDTANQPPTLGNLRLTDPLVQRKYLADPDMMRFLRGIYAESCTRGMVRGAVTNIRHNYGKKYTKEQQQAAAVVLDSNRVWKLTSLEMEMLLGASYLRAANYCDCVVKELTDHDVIAPDKTVELIKELPEKTLKICNGMAEDLTEQQLKTRKTLKDLLRESEKQKK